MGSIDADRSVSVSFHTPTERSTPAMNTLIMNSGKQRILDAAAAIFAKKGYGAASIAIIGQEAGVSKATVFHHFETKEKLYQQVLLYTFETVSKIWGETIEQGSGDFARDLKNITTKTLEFQEQHSDTVTLLIREVLDSKVNDAPVINTEITEFYFEKITQSIKLAAKNSNHKEPINAEEITLSILSHALFHFVFGESLAGIKRLSFLKDNKKLAAWLTEKRLS